MIECVKCHTQREDLRSICPACGNQEFLSSTLKQEGAAGLAAMNTQIQAALHINQGFQFFIAKQYDNATAELQQAIDINPFNANAYSNIGCILIEQGDIHKAVPWLEKALEINPYLEGVSEMLQQIKTLATIPEMRCVQERWWQFWK